MKVVLRVELDVDVDAWMDAPGGDFQLVGAQDVPSDVEAWLVDLVAYSQMARGCAAVELRRVRRLAR